MYRKLAALSIFLTLATVPACATTGGFRAEILVDGRPVPVYSAQNTRYVEALKGKEYSIRLHNPLGVRVAVALSVDGLNTIDASRTNAARAQKWVLGPYETVTISGWQTNMEQARRFYFTSEEQSYGQWLGKTDNLGIISAVFFRERVPPPPPQPIITPGKRSQQAPAAEPQARDDSARARSSSSERAAGAAADRSMKMEEYAATGIGERVQHHVSRVRMELEDTPVATVNTRYEYRAQLVRLGIFPPTPRYPDPLARRQNARGFEPGFCPEPK